MNSIDKEGEKNRTNVQKIFIILVVFPNLKKEVLIKLQKPYTVPNG